MDTERFNAAFEDHRPQLRAFLLRMTASTEDAEDLVQDTYLKAHAGLSGYRGESSLKTWIFAIGSNLARDLLRHRKRWPEHATDICREAALANREFLGEMMQIRMTSPQGQFEIREHIAFCFTCISKSLPLEQQLVLLLKEVCEFRVKEIAGIIGNTEAMVKYYLHTARQKMIGIFDNRCSLISKNGICHQCSELNGIFNPKQNLQEELVKIEMARDAENKDKETLFDLRMRIIQAIDPYESEAAELQLHHLQHNKQVIENYLEKN